VGKPLFRGGPAQRSRARGARGSAATGGRIASRLWYAKILADLSRQMIIDFSVARDGTALVL